MIMGACNFYTKNARTYYLAPEQDCEDYDYLLEDLGYVAGQCGLEFISNKDYLKEIERKANGNMRDYYGAAIPYIFECDAKDKFDGYWRVRLVPLMRSGYYTGAVLDYYIELRTEYGEDLTDDDVLNKDVIAETINDYYEYLRDYENTEATSGDAFDLMDLIDGLIEEAQNKFDDFCKATCWDDYFRAGVFSNEEAVYINKTKLAEKALKKGETDMKTITLENLSEMTPEDLLNNFHYTEENKEYLDKLFNDESVDDEEYFDKCYEVAKRQLKGK